MNQRLRRHVDLLKAYLGPQWVSVSFLLVLMLIGIGLSLLGPRILGVFIDAVQVGASTQDLLTYAAIFLGAAAVGQGVSLAVTYLSGTVGWRATNSLRADLTSHCMALDLAFHKAHTPGELIERIDGDVSMLAEFFSQMFVELVGNGLLGIGVLVALYIVDWRVGLVGSAYALGVFLAIRALRERATRAWKRNREGETSLFGFLSEYLYGMEDIRGNGAESFVLSQVRRLMEATATGRVRAVATRRVQSSLVALIFAIAQVLALALSAWLLTRGASTIGTVFLTLSYVALLQQPVTRIQRQAGDLQRATAGIDRIHAMLDTQPSIVPGNQSSRLSRALPREAASISFRGVSFRYRETPSPSAPAKDEAADTRWALQDISFALAPGRVLGLLGRTGSGKSTITRLLFRFYDPDEGIILLDGVDIRELGLDDLRHRIGLVTQDVQIFRATVRDNLTVFNREIPNSRLYAALEALGLAPWVASLPEGLDTQLQSGSEGLSAGEAQLLDLARVFLKDPDLIILDEASARIDPATEHLLDRAIAELLTGRTAIIIAHRLSTLGRVDDVLVLDHGRAIEFGEREQLAGDENSHFHRLLQTDLQEVLV